MSKNGELTTAQFAQWFIPLLNALKDLGGAATPEQAKSKIIENLDLSDDVVSETRGKTGHKKFDNDVAWARNYLVNEGIIDKSIRGVWTLTDKGKQIDLTEEMVDQIIKKWRNKLKDDDTLSTADKDVPKTRYWIYAPGENSRKWDEVYSQGVMAIGWDNMGDLSKYSSREEMRERMKVIWDESKAYRNDSLATWQFCNDVKPGDIVFAKKGLHWIVGRGVVESDYMFDDNRSEYKHLHNVKWTNKGEWEHPGQAVLKTLTDITSYTDYVQKLEFLFAEDFDTTVIDEEKEKRYPIYSEIDFLSEVFMIEEKYAILSSLLKNKQNIILQGAPGVGKTFAAKRLAYSIMGVKDTSRVMMVQFHQSYSYEDFIMGYRPTKDGFELTPGPFYQFCKKAEDDIERDYFFIIDEINRGNLGKIFGELLMLIEKDKRGEKIRLLYANELFGVPQNVHIIGMMNTADRSLAMIDYALRRRFAFFELIPAFDSDGFKTMIQNADNPNFEELVRKIEELNEVIEKDESLGSGFKIGHSYLCTGEAVTDEYLSSIIEFELLPLISEYWFDDRTKIDHWTKKIRSVLDD